LSFKLAASEQPNLSFAVIGGLALAQNVPEHFRAIKGDGTERWGD
jgi:hypothetical protein